MSEPTLTSLAIEIAELRKDVKSAFALINEQKSLAESVQKLATKVELQGRDLTGAVKNLSELTSEIKEIKLKPARRWESIVAQFISLIVAVVFAMLIAKIGL